MIVKLEDLKYEYRFEPKFEPEYTLKSNDDLTFINEAYAKITDVFNRHTEHIKKVAVDTILYSLHDMDKTLKYHKIISDEQCIGDLSCWNIEMALYEIYEPYSAIFIRDNIWDHMAKRYVETFISFPEISKDITGAIGFCCGLKCDLARQIYNKLDNNEYKEPYDSFLNYIMCELWDKPVNELYNMSFENCKDLGLLSFMKSWGFKKVRLDDFFNTYESPRMYEPYSDREEPELI